MRVMKNIQKFVLFFACCTNFAFAQDVYDKSRDRSIPIQITYPEHSERCTTNSKCPVAFISAGYGVSHLKYTFVSTELNKLGYLVIAIGHELPGDPALSVKGNLYETRSENWIRGAKTLDFLKSSLSKRFSRYNFEKLTLVGHSNGGDISAWLANEGKRYVDKIITLDHRRMPLPRNSDIKVLSVRASDFPADKGVLHTLPEQRKFGSCIVKIPKAKHNDIADIGPVWLKDKISLIISGFLKKQPCEQLRKV